MNNENWHEGNLYDARVLLPLHDPYPDDFSCQVQVKDRKTGTIKTYKGKGKFVGNFSPIWITFQKQRIQLTQLLMLS